MCNLFYLYLQLVIPAPADRVNSSCKQGSARPAWELFTLHTCPTNIMPHIPSLQASIRSVVCRAQCTRPTAAARAQQLLRHPAAKPGARGDGKRTALQRTAVVVKGVMVCTVVVVVSKHMAQPT